MTCTNEPIYHGGMSNGQKPEIPPDPSFIRYLELSAKTLESIVIIAWMALSVGIVYIKIS
jgi:hypothetical protein